jgi:prepilin-type N-terminal cleavage/methylation domain-containing protein
MSGALGFTLIELLVVIAIIALLAAILFPVFATVREKARQATEISNMHQVQLALTQFEADYRQPPKVLFGYVYTSGGKIVPMDRALAQIKADKQDPKLYFPGLYPEFINDVTVFEDPDNPVTDTSKDTGGLNVTLLCTSPNYDQQCQNPAVPVGSYIQGTHDFYVADALDTSPQITGPNAISNTVYVPRYQTSWTAVPNTHPNPLDVTDPINGHNNFERQMAFFRTAPDDTYVTLTTYHVPKNAVIALFRSGNAKVIPPTVLLKYGADPPALTVSGNPPVCNANFWKVSPTSN